MINSYTQQTCTLYAEGTLDKFGAKTPGAASTVPCRFVQKAHYTSAEDGRLIKIASGVLYVAADVSLTAGQRVDVDGVTYEVVQADDMRGLFGELEGRKVLVK